MNIEKLTFDKIFPIITLVIGSLIPLMCDILKSILLKQSSKKKMFNALLFKILQTWDKIKSEQTKKIKLIKDIEKVKNIAEKYNFSDDDIRKTYKSILKIGKEYDDLLSTRFNIEKDNYIFKNNPLIDYNPFLSNEIQKTYDNIQRCILLIESQDEIIANFDVNSTDKTIEKFFDDLNNENVDNTLINIQELLLSLSFKINIFIYLKTKFYLFKSNRRYKSSINNDLNEVIEKINTVYKLF
jgi:hypothetical protein